MLDDLDAALGFAPDFDSAIPYMLRTREYYKAIGYTTPYRWAHYVEAPFQKLAKPLSQMKVTLVSTAAPYQPGKGDQGPGAPYNGSAKFYDVLDYASDQEHDTRISHIGYDRKNTTATDKNSWWPHAQLRRAVAEGRIGSLAPRFFGAPTNRSHRVTVETDAPTILARCREDGVEAAVLVPNCPVCHQTISLVARHLEANGIPTVVMGCAKDIVEHAAVPRFLWSDFPLGNAAGKPHDEASQVATLDQALALLEGAVGPRTTMQNRLRWAENPDWKLNYLNLERIPAEELAKLRAEFDKQKLAAKAVQNKAA